MRIELENISKGFGNKIVLQKINLTITSSQIYCLLGRNGAGKSTLINIACNLINPDEGNVFINGQTYLSKGINLKQSIGLQSQYDTLIEELNTFDYLHFIGKVYNMKHVDISSQIDLLTRYFFENLSELKNSISTYSTGMRRKVSLCAAFLHKPSIVFLDEPFANIDSVAANELCRLIQRYKDNNRCIIISSHDLLYVDKIATNIGVIDNQNLVFNNTIEEFRTGAGLDIDLFKYVKTGSNDDSLLEQIIQ